MIDFRGKLILLDIEGTVSPLAFVHDVMFPYVREHVADFLAAHLQDARVRKALEQMALDAGHASFGEWCPAMDDPQAFIVGAVHQLMDADVKATGLKMLQGLLWEQGFRSGDLRSTLFADVVPALDRWRESGREIRIYSSGSIHAQRLFFAHTTAGDLTPRLSGHYDTTIGPKKDAASYTAIAADCHLPAGDILFISDLADELHAAQSAGLKTALALRPGNQPQMSGGHPAIAALDEVHILG